MFEIAKTGGGYASTPTTLVSFNGANGAYSTAGLTADAAGNLFGTTQAGGAGGAGTAFELTGTGFVVAVAATPGITLDKQVSVDGGLTWHDIGSGGHTDDPSTIAGATVEFRAVVTNTSTGGLSETVSVSDAGPTGSFTFGISNSATVTLAAGDSATSNIITIAAVAGLNTDTATASGTAHDSSGNPTTTTATDTATYDGVGLSTAGMGLGYWYNHQSGWGNGTNVLLGDANGDLTTDNSESTLFVAKAAAIRLIDSSQSANDTRQTLMSQAEGAQLSIDHGAKDPGYDPNDFGTAVTGHDLISEAVAWLTGHGPLGTAGSSVYNDGIQDGTLDITSAGSALDYNTSTGAFTSTALASSSVAWHSFATAETNFTDINGNNVASISADGEGLKNALQAFNQNHLMVSSDGSLIGWNTGSSLIDVHQNGPDVFWGILHDQHITGVS